MLTHGERIKTRRAELLDVFAPIGGRHHPVLEPLLKILEFAALLVILGEKSMIAAIVALHRRRMRPAGLMHHRRDEKSGHQRAIRIRSDHFRRYDFLRDDDYFPRGAR